LYFSLLKPQSPRKSPKKSINTGDQFYVVIYFSKYFLGELNIGTSIITRTTGFVQEYLDRLKDFKPNARLYLITVVITGATMGVYRLLFNFYILSLGYNEDLIGNLLSVSSLTALIAALPMGYITDKIGRRTALLLGGFFEAASILVIVIFPITPVFYAMNFVIGAAQSLSAVAYAPFLMENSGEKERTYLFSISSGLNTASAFVGNWIGGYLPTWFSTLYTVSATSSRAYESSLIVVAVGTILGLSPLLFLQKYKTPIGEKSVFAPISYARKEPKLLNSLILPMMVTSIGAGLIMPFMNVFFRQQYHQPDTTIGSMFAWGSLAMGIGLMIAPPLAERYGKIQLVVFTQALSIPFLALLGFSPVFWMSAAAYYFRLALMNMSGPVYQTYVMEKVDPDARAMVASLVSMASNFGWAISPTISGWLQVRWGFGPSFIGTIILYILSTWLYWRYFCQRQPEHGRPEPV
jgi:MFS family permease